MGKRIRVPRLSVGPFARPPDIAPPRLGGIYAVMDLAGYGSILLGYLDAILAARHVSWQGVALLSAGNLLWVVLCAVYYHSGPRARLRWSKSVALIGTAVLAQSSVWCGLQWDWLLPLVTVAMLSMEYELPAALSLCTLTWTLSVAVLVGGGGYASVTAFLQDQAGLLPAVAFAFFLPRATQQQRVQRLRAEALIVELEAAQEQLRAHAREVEELAVTRERNRMTREIHDTLGHHLTILTVKLETALKLHERADPRLADELRAARRVASECLGEVRTSVAALRPADPTSASLASALAALVAGAQEGAPETEFVLDVEGDLQNLSLEVRVAVYRCVQESLTNIRKHADATKVLVRLRLEADELVLLVRDNGRGSVTRSGAQQPGFGLVGMRERIVLLGGTLRCGSEPGAGWRVELCVPRCAGNAALTQASAPASTTIGRRDVPDGEVPMVATLGHPPLEAQPAPPVGARGGGVPYGVGN